MTQELLYTSAPRGLKPGIKGFCTVASTAGMAPTLAERLESLSGYKHLFPPHDRQAQLNPVLFSHLIVKVGGQVLHVLSRICDAGLDYSQRSNKFAHHVALTESELVPAGPAWVLSQPGFMETDFAGDPRILSAGRKVPRGDAPPRVCRAWESLAGDAGWAGVLAEAALGASPKTVNVIYRPGTDVLALIHEALALVPAARRWGVTFSTYYTKLPPGLDCQWRFLVDGEAEAKTARRTPQTLLIDLCSQLGPAEGGSLVAAARTGILPEAAAPEATPVGHFSAAPSVAVAPFLPRFEQPYAREPASRPTPASEWPISSPAITSDRRLGSRRSMVADALKLLIVAVLIAGAYLWGEKRGGERVMRLAIAAPGTAPLPTTSKGNTEDRSLIHGRDASAAKRGQDKNALGDTNNNNNDEPGHATDVNGAAGDTLNPSYDSNRQPEVASAVRPQDSANGPGTEPEATKNTVKVDAGPQASSGAALTMDSSHAAPSVERTIPTEPPFSELDKKLWKDRGLGLKPVDSNINGPKNHHDLVKLFLDNSGGLGIELWSPEWSGDPPLKMQKESKESSVAWTVKGGGETYGKFAFLNGMLAFDWEPSSNSRANGQRQLQAEAWLRVSIGHESREIPLRTPNPIAELQATLAPGPLPAPRFDKTKIKESDVMSAKLELRRSDGPAIACIIPQGQTKAAPAALTGGTGTLKWRIYFTGDGKTKEFSIKIDAIGTGFSIPTDDDDDDDDVVTKPDSPVTAKAITTWESGANKLVEKLSSQIKAEQKREKRNPQRIHRLEDRRKNASDAVAICKKESAELMECANRQLTFRVYKKNDIADQ